MIMFAAPVSCAVPTELYVPVATCGMLFIRRGCTVWVLDVSVGNNSSSIAVVLPSGCLVDKFSSNFFIKSLRFSQFSFKALSEILRVHNELQKSVFITILTTVLTRVWCLVYALFWLSFGKDLLLDTLIKCIVNASSYHREEQWIAYSGQD